MDYDITTDPAEAALSVDALLEAIPGADPWHQILWADELAETMWAFDAVPPEVEAAFNNVFRPRGKAQPFQKPD